MCVCLGMFGYRACVEYVVMILKLQNPILTITLHSPLHPIIQYAIASLRIEHFCYTYHRQRMLLDIKLFCFLCYD